MINKSTNMLASKYKLRDLGAQSKYMGWASTRTANGPINLSKTTLIAKTLKKAGLPNAYTKNSPLPKNAPLDDAEGTRDLTHSDQYLY